MPARRDLCAVVQAIGEDSIVTIAQLCERLGLTWHACYERLKELVRRGAVKSVRRGRGGTPGLYALALPLDDAMALATEAPARESNILAAVRALETSWPTPISRYAQ